MDRKVKTTKDYCELLRTCHNIVLTGAPGTGKTYLARQIAAKMVLGKNVDDLEKLEDDEKDILKERTAFVQFHPSYDYTDFVEGLRPVPKTDGGNEIVFERRDGIFKEFCKKSFGYYCPENDLESGGQFSISEDSIRSIYGNIIDRIKNGENIKVETFRKKEKTLELVTSDKIGWARSDGKESDPDGTPIDTIISIFHSYPTKEEFKQITPSKLRKPGMGSDPTMHWAITNYIWGEIDKRKGCCSLDKQTESQPCVFIIDEINRGELSKIFGELFFSIDPSYRGEKGRVNTQYQNLVKKTDEDGNKDPFFKGFFVPDNVYIIGTMNDIDRSIESMDFAIRRRFAWVEVKANDNTEMLSNLKTVERSKAEKVMFALNNAIWDDDAKKGIEGLSRAYHIGASYFLKLDNFKESDNPFVDLWDLHLEGLLREYLRGLDEAKEKLNTLQKAYNEAAGING